MRIMSNGYDPPTCMPSWKFLDENINSPKWWPYAILITVAFFSRFRLDKPNCQAEAIQVYWLDFTCKSMKSVQSQFWTLNIYYGHTKFIAL